MDSVEKSKLALGKDLKISIHKLFFPHILLHITFKKQMTSIRDKTAAII